MDLRAFTIFHLLEIHILRTLHSCKTGLNFCQSVRCQNRTRDQGWKARTLPLCLPWTCELMVMLDSCYFVYKVLLTFKNQRKQLSSKKLLLSLQLEFRFRQKILRVENENEKNARFRLFRPDPISNRRLTKFRRRNKTWKQVQSKYFLKA